jgi:hypothetical protein
MPKYPDDELHGTLEQKILNIIFRIDSKAIFDG